MSFYVKSSFDVSFLSLLPSIMFFKLKTVYLYKSTSKEGQKQLYTRLVLYIIVFYPLWMLICTIKGTNGCQKTYEIFHVYCIFYSGFMCQTTVMCGITKDESLVLNTLAS